MDVHNRPPYDNPSTSYLHEDMDYKQPFVDDEVDYNYPPAQRPQFYPPTAPSKPSYSDSTDLEVATDEGDFSTSRQVFHAPPPVEKDPRSCFQRVSASSFNNRAVSQVVVIQYLPSSLACRLYLLVVLLQTAVDVVMEADILIQFDDLPPGAAAQADAINSQRLPVYLGIFALAQYAFLWRCLMTVSNPKPPSVFQFILAIDAVIFRNTLQFVFLVYVTLLQLPCTRLTALQHL
jgi:hypothetical protein